jgi:hypothetical protein
MAAWIGQGLKGMMGVNAGVHHQGGMAGYAEAYRTVDSSAFLGARRYHWGMGPDEVPAILQRGEVVLPKGTVSSMDRASSVFQRGEVVLPKGTVYGGGQTPSVEVIINNNGQAVTATQDKVAYNPQTGKVQVYMTMQAMKGDPMLRQAFREAMKG